jgi:SET domain-containing protein
MNDSIKTLTCVKESALHGKGLFAREDIKQDTVIGVLTGKPVNHDGLHVLWMNDGQDKFQVENDLKFINHGKQANVAYYDDFTVVALKNIPKGEELLHNYGDDWD